MSRQVRKPSPSTEIGARASTPCARCPTSCGGDCRWPTSAPSRTKNRAPGRCAGTAWRRNPPPAARHPGRGTPASARRHSEHGPPGQRPQYPTGAGDGFRPTAHAVIDCTGPALPERVRDAGNPVIADLVGSGLARINDQGLGLDTDPDGAVRSAGPAAAATPGGRCLPQGPIWETTAVPADPRPGAPHRHRGAAADRPSREAALRGVW